MSSVFAFAMPSSADTSVSILTQIIGPVVTDIVTGTNTSGGTPLGIFAGMLQSFNMYLLGFGTIIFAIMLFIGTMNTAADGQFLGRDWNSMWIPIRLVVGLLFVVPLQSGLCVGQYIFLYLILIGVNIATQVWDSVVTNIFDNAAPPPIPSYVTNTAKDVVFQQILLFSEAYIQSYLSDQSPAMATGSGIQVTLSPQTVSALTGMIPLNTLSGNTVINGGDGQGWNDTIGDLCGWEGYSGLTPYCTQAVINVLTGHAGSGKAQSLMQGDTSGVHYYVWLDSTGTHLNTWSNLLQWNLAAPPMRSYYGGDVGALGLHTPPTNTSWDINQGADGKFIISGTYTYNIQAALAPQEQQTAAAIDIGGFFSAKLYSEVNNFIVNNIVVPSPIMQPPALPPAQPTPPSPVTSIQLPQTPCPNNSCDVTPVVTTLLALANSQVVVYQEQQASQAVPPQPGQKPNPANNVYCAAGTEGPTCELRYNLSSYAVPGLIEYTKKHPAGKQTYNVIDLLGSWWSAGDSYLILDDQMSQNLNDLLTLFQRYLYDFSNLTSIGTGTGNINLQFQLMIGEVGAMVWQSTPNLGTDAAWTSGCWQHTSLNTHGTDYLSCYIDQLRLSNIIQTGSGQGSAMTVHSINASVGVSEGSQVWLNEIAPYDPDASNPTPGQVTIGNNPADQLEFYNQLLTVPTDLQLPFQLLLQYAIQQQAAGSNPHCGGGQINCLILVQPYIQNMLNVLLANHLMNLPSGNAQVTIPVTQVMNGIFSDLLGSIGPDQESSGPDNGALVTIMQEVYNLGEPSKSTSIASTQYSQMTQIRNLGMSIMISCVHNMEDVYSHVSDVTQQLISEVQNIQGIAAGQVSGFAWASIVPLIGSGFTGASQYIQTTAEIQMLTVITMTMTSLSISLMWLPLFMFVITSMLMMAVQFAILIPLTPYILFWAGQMAWVLGVIEALVAAPLVMLGIAHPGGNQYMGHAQPAIRMMMGVLFRPVLMVIGMVTGILLTYVLITYSAQGFHVIADGIISSAPPGASVTDAQTLQGLLAILMLFIYGSFLVMAFTKCFSPIYTIPEKVVEWIGGTAVRAGEQELSQFSGAVQQTSQQGTQAAGSSLQQGVQAQQQKGQQVSDMTKQEFAMQGSATRELAGGINKSATDVGGAAFSVKG